MNTLRHHYPEYLMEAAGLGLFMISASVITVILEHAASPIHQTMAEPWRRRFKPRKAEGTKEQIILHQ